MKKKTSLKDIAEKLGVSVALVSYVLNKKKEGRIRKEVAEKIRKTAEELNYSTNQIARSLKTNKTFTIGLIVADISNPFFSGLARIIEDEAEKYGYSVIFCSSDENAEKSWKLMNVLLNRQVDGLIISCAENAAPHICYLHENEIPFVLIDRYFPDLNVSYVAIDNYKASHAAVSHLIEKGNRRIAIVTYNSSLVHLVQRKDGYLAAMKDNNLPLNESWIKEVNYSNMRRDTEKAVKELVSLDEPVEAILFASNTLSTAALQYINTLRLKVPDDLSIVSFDESDASNLFYAPLTHIRQPLEEIGKMATDILIEAMNGDGKVRQLNIEAELVIGQSTLKSRALLAK